MKCHLLSKDKPNQTACGIKFKTDRFHLRTTKDDIIVNIVSDKSLPRITCIRCLFK